MYKSLEARRIYQRSYYAKNKEKRQLWAKGSRARRQPQIRDYMRTFSWQRKTKVLTAYGGKCACCGETDMHFLTLDHILGDGRAHRRELGGTSNVYQWLIDNNFPPGFQVLCVNCNCAKQWYGGCPHNFPPDPEEYIREAETAI